jgi:hypothetical protein
MTIQSVGASQLTVPLKQVAQVKNERGLMIDQPGQDQTSQQPETERSMTIEDRKAREAILNGKVQRLEEEIHGQKGTRKNLLTVAVAAFSIGSTLAFGVNTINDAIDKIAVEYPQGTECIEDWQNACEEYEDYNEEKRDAQDSLDAIKGIGGGIFIVGIVSVAGYLIYSWNIRGKQQKVVALQEEAGTLFTVRGLTPEYLSRNESVAAVIDEIDDLKKKAGSHRTQGEIFSRLALGTLASGVFLVGLSNVSHTVVGNITIDEADPRNVQSKEEALDKTDELKTVGGILIGTGAAAGVVSLVFSRLAKSKENQADEYEDSLWRVAERIEFQPKLNGFTVMYTQAF